MMGGGQLYGRGMSFPPRVAGGRIAWSEGETNIREAIQLHIESLRSHGQPIPQNENIVHVEELTVGIP